MTKELEAFNGVCRLNKNHRFWTDDITGRLTSKACCGHPIEYKKAYKTPKLNAKQVKDKANDKSTE